MLCCVTMFITTEKRRWETPVQITSKWWKLYEQWWITRIISVVRMRWALRLSTMASAWNWLRKHSKAKTHRSLYLRLFWPSFLFSLFYYSVQFFICVRFTVSFSLLFVTLLLFSMFEKYKSIIIILLALALHVRGIRLPIVWNVMESSTHIKPNTHTERKNQQQKQQKQQHW